MHRYKLIPQTYFHSFMKFRTFHDFLTGHFKSNYLTVENSLNYQVFKNNYPINYEICRMKM